MSRRRPNTTKLEIIQTATELFLEHGYSGTSPGMISNVLDISTGNLTYHFPTKEHILTELVGMLIGFQWKLMEEEANEGISSVLAICLELTTMASACEEDPVLRDFFLSSYQSPMCLAIIQENDARRAGDVFRPYCPNWTDEQFAEAEILVSGIEYATLMASGGPVPLETRIAGALHSILGIYNIPEEMRQTKLQKVFAMDYKKLGDQARENFRKYVTETNEQALCELLNQRTRNRGTPIS